MGILVIGCVFLYFGRKLYTAKNISAKEYKKATFGVCVDVKMSIFYRFIKIDAPMQLNLRKISKSIEQ
jgi:hypothetical protein